MVTDVVLLVKGCVESKHRKKIEDIADYLLIKLRAQNGGFLSDQFISAVCLFTAIRQIEFIQLCVAKHTPAVIDEHRAEIEALACEKIVNLCAGNEGYSHEFLGTVAFFYALHKVLNEHVHNPEVYKSIIASVLMSVSSSIKMEGKTQTEVSDLIYVTAYKTP